MIGASSSQNKQDIGGMMAKFLGSHALWTEIRNQAKRSKSLTIISAYLGSKPDTLIRWPRRALVVADITEENVLRGVCSARGALRLRQRGVAVLQARDLHAKIYLFDKAAIVCSANLSSDSANRLIEAGVLMKGAELGPVRAEVRRIVRRAVLLDRQILVDWAQREPKRTGPVRPIPVVKPVSRVPISNGHPAWLIDTSKHKDAPGEARAKAQRGKALSAEHSIDSARIDWLSACSQSLYQKIQDGDWLVLWWKEGTRAKHGKLEGPYECLGPVDLGAKLKQSRYAIPIVPRRMRTVSLTDHNSRGLFRALGRSQMKRAERLLKPNPINELVRLLR